MLLAAALLAKHCFDSSKAETRAQASSDGLNTYHYDLVFRPDEGTLSVTLTLDFTNRTEDTLSEIVLRTWAGAYASEDTSPAAIEETYDACYPNGFSAGDIRLEGVWWNGQIADAAFSDDARTVLSVLIDPLEPGKNGQLLMHCELIIPHCAHRFGTDGSTWLLGNALPILSVWQDGAWRDDAYSAIGEPFISECANYEVTLIAPAGYVCASGADDSSEKTADGRIRYTIQGSAMRDFALALSDTWHTAQKTVNGIRITAYAGGRDAAKRMAGYAAQALKIYNRLYGDYAYDQLTICAADFPLGGMSYPGLILIGEAQTSEEEADSLELLIAHEAAHQWFGALVGNDQTTDAWQDEALCEHAMLCYAREKYGSSAYENLRLLRVEAPVREKIGQAVTPGAPISYFGSWQTYSTVVYGRGAALLVALEEMTDGKLDEMLHDYCDVYAFKLASREDFERFFSEQSGMDILPLMQDYLDTYGY